MRKVSMKYKQTYIISELDRQKIYKAILQRMAGDDISKEESELLRAMNARCHSIYKSTK